MPPSIFDDQRQDRKDTIYFTHHLTYGEGEKKTAVFFLLRINAHKTIFFVLRINLHTKFLRLSQIILNVHVNSPFLLHEPLEMVL
jgi:hypothetical protein